MLHARCQGRRGAGVLCNKLLLRHTTDCLVAGAVIEVKCPSCNHLTIIGLNQSSK